jgi:hypothetical protein
LLGIYVPMLDHYIGECMVTMTEIYKSWYQGISLLVIVWIDTILNPNGIRAIIPRYEGFLRGV